MYYFGTNLENRFSVPDFWPKPEQTYKIPFEKQEIHGELERLRQRRLEKRARRLDSDEDVQGAIAAARAAERASQEAAPAVQAEKDLSKTDTGGGGWLAWLGGRKDG